MAARDPLPPFIAEIARERQLGDLIQLFALGQRDSSAFKEFTHVWAFEHGFVRSHPKKQGYDCHRWDDVERFTRAIIRNTVNGTAFRNRYHMYFRMKDGSDVSIVDVSPGSLAAPLAGLIPIADALITRCQLPGMQAAIGRGEPIQFGALRVDADGLHKRTFLRPNGKKVLWGQVTDVEVIGGFVQVRVAGKRLPWAALDVALMGNVGAFLALVRPRIAGQ
jgi:hypothetical protein